MSFHAVTHITVCVPGPLREAEAYYSWLFGLAVAWREPVPENAPFHVTWAEHDAAGVAPVIVMLHSGAFRLAVTPGESRPVPGVIDHVGLQVDEADLVSIRERATSAGADVVNARGNELFDFLDRYGVEWELDTRSFENPVAIEQKRDRARAGA